MPRTSRDENLTLVILAAGLSRRFGRPKPLEPLGPRGETLPQYAVYDALRAGFARIVLVAHPDSAELLREHLRARVPAGVDVAVVPQAHGPEVPARARPWGTGAAVLAAGGSLGGPFAVANADDLYGAAAFAAAAGHLRAHAQASAGARSHAIVGFRLRETLSAAGGVSRAVCKVTTSGALLGIEEVLDARQGAGSVVGRAAVSGESRALAGDEMVSMNLWAFFPDVLPALADAFARFCGNHADSEDAEFLIGDAVQGLVTAGSARIRVLPCDSTWHGITHPADREPFRRALAALIDEGCYPCPLPGHR